MFVVIVASVCWEEAQRPWSVLVSSLGVQLQVRPLCREILILSALSPPLLMLLEPTPAEARCNAVFLLHPLDLLSMVSLEESYHHSLD